MKTRHTEKRSVRRGIVVFGPPLPGRMALARALERQLPAARRVRAEDRLPTERVTRLLAEGSTPIVEADLATADERRAFRQDMRAAGIEPVFVAWTCDAADADRDIYRRYASIPRRYADHWRRLWEADRRRRQPTGNELRDERVVAASSVGAVQNDVDRIAMALGLDPREAQPRWPEPPRRVLVVDDERDARQILADTLGELGCEVIQAASGEQALRIAREETLDLVVSDQQMPGMAGHELARELVRRHPDLVVALLTGYAEETVDDAVREDGVAVLLSKPARAADLVRVLDDLADCAADAGAVAEHPVYG